MDIKFDGQTALVTGAGKGIGRGVAVALAKGGATVYALTRTQADLDDLVKESIRIRPVLVDIGDWDATRAAVENCGAIDLLVNNAGVACLQKFMEVTPETWDTVLNINLKAVVNISQVAAKGMIERKKGAIVNVSSQASKIGLEEHSAYCASKGGLDQLTRVMAKELGPYNIRVNCVNPTVVMTTLGRACWGGEKGDPMRSRIPLNRFAEVSEVVDAIMYLLSDRASMINGIMMPIDGGLLAT